MLSVNTKRHPGIRKYENFTETLDTGGALGVWLYSTKVLRQRRKFSASAVSVHIQRMRHTAERWAEIRGVKDW